jgi:hypothetical protein
MGKDEGRMLNDDSRPREKQKSESGGGTPGGK